MIWNSNYCYGHCSYTVLSLGLIVSSRNYIISDKTSNSGAKNESYFIDVCNLFKFISNG